MVSSARPPRIVSAGSVTHPDVLLPQLQLCAVFVDDGVELTLAVVAQHLHLVVQAAAGPAAHHQLVLLVLL